MNPLDPNVLLLDTRDAGPIWALLEQLAPKVVLAAEEESPELGLTRWTLANTAEAAASARAERTSLLAELNATDLPDVDVLLALVRDGARTRYAGWSPVIDRNDELVSIQTDPHGKPFAAVPHLFAGPGAIGIEPVSLPVPISVVTAPPVLLSVAPIPAQRVGWGYPDGPWVGVADARPFAHPDLAGRYLGAALVDGDPTDSYAPKHTTFVAGTILRRAPSARLICHQVIQYPEEGEGGDPTLNTSWEVAKRLMSFLGSGVEILNMSFSCYSDGPPLALERAISRLAAQTVLVASAGNFVLDGVRQLSPAYPGAFGDVVSVAAEGLDFAEKEGDPPPPWVDVTTKGVGVVGPAQLPGGDASDGYATWSGSSFAAANVTGEIARLMVTEGLDAFAARDRIIQHGVTP